MKDSNAGVVRNPGKTILSKRVYVKSRLLRFVLNDVVCYVIQITAIIKEFFSI